MISSPKKYISWSNHRYLTRKRKRSQNDKDNKFDGKWSTNDYIWRTAIFLLFVKWLQQQSIYLPAVNILFSITASLGNTLTLVALHKESSLHPPSKLFSRRCPATTDMLVALVTQPLHATHWMSVVYRH